MATDTAMSIQSVQKDMRRVEVVDITDLEAVNEFALAAQDPMLAIQALAGMPPNKILYSFKQGKETIVGLTVAAMRALAGKRGGLQTHPPQFQEITTPVEDHEGNWRDVPAVRAVVLVEDMRTGTIFCGTATQAKFIIIKYGDKVGQMRLDAKADQVAASKAERNAISSHFAGVVETLKDLAKEALDQRQAFFSGETTQEVDQVSRNIHVQQAKRRAMRSGAPIGPLGRTVFLNSVKATEVEAGLDEGALKPDLDAFQGREWPGLKMADIPAMDMPLLGAWLRDKRKQLGLPVDGDEQADDASDFTADDDPTADDEFSVSDDARETQAIDYETGEITDDADEPADQLPLEPEKPQAARKPRKAEPAQDADEEAAY